MLTSVELQPCGQHYVTPIRMCKSHIEIQPSTLLMTKIVSRLDVRLPSSKLASAAFQASSYICVPRSNQMCLCKCVSLTLKLHVHVRHRNGAGACRSSRRVQGAGVQSTGGASDNHSSRVLFVVGLQTECDQGCRKVRCRSDRIPHRGVMQTIT